MATNGGSGRSAMLSPMGQAALGYARRGWPVFPCREVDLELPARGDRPQRTIKAKSPLIRRGFKDATLDEAAIAGWWRRWPKAMIGVALGEAGLFALDFDPRVDAETGEVYTLDSLKAATEAQIGCALPTSLAAVTPSGGVHVYLRQPGTGDPIRNRGTLPEHVDVRGVGGYVIVPPSIVNPGTPDEQRYRWLRGSWDAEIVEAPAALVETLRAPKARAVQDVAAAQAASASPSPRPPRRDGGSDPSDAIRRYALAALDGELADVRGAPSGRRNAQLNTSALKIASLVAAGALDATLARACLEAAARDNPGQDDAAQLSATINSGWSTGLANPRDLGEIARAAERRRPPPRAARQDRTTQPFRGGSLAGQEQATGPGDDPLTAAERAQLGTMARASMRRRIEHCPRERRALTALAFAIGRWVAGGLIEEGAAKEALWPAHEDVADLSGGDIDRAIADGIARGFDPGPMRLTLACAAYPMTDFGIAERFRDRFGGDYRFTTAKGWLGWDGRRWKVLDQEKDVPPAEVIAAVFETIRAIQGEARAIGDTGVRVIGPVGDAETQSELDVIQPNPHGLDRWIPKGAKSILLSAQLAIWGRQSETAGKPAAVATLARRWLTVPIEAFDTDPLALNVLNGTLRFARERGADGTRGASYRLTPHAREDFNTRLAPVAFDPEAACPTYDAFFAWAHPDAATRSYLHVVAGYSFTGDTSEQKLWFHYGLGANGKSTWMDLLAEVAGDYAGSIGIETFLDQGIKKRGEQASPDLARLGGVRFLRASEPERGSKLNEALIKAATGGEPMPVRALHRGFFDLRPLFALHVGGNYKPEIPGTDEGIWRRMKLVPWTSHVADADRDETLPAKLRAELPGVLNHIVRGLLTWLTDGLAEPEAVSDATAQYREDSDPLARFLKLCTEPDPQARVQSSKLHEVFVAWCKAAGEREWTQKGFSAAMVNKGFSKKASDGMQWLGLRLVRQAHDFVDETGRVVTLPDAAPDPAPEAKAPTGRAAEAAARGPPPTPPPPSASDWFDED